MNGLSALLTLKKDYPSLAIMMPNDTCYCTLTPNEFKRGHKKWVSYAKWFRLWEWRAQRTDCDDAAYEYSNYFHRLYNNPLVPVVFDNDARHSYNIVFFNAEHYMFVEPRRVDTILTIENPNPARLERA